MYQFKLDLPNNYDYKIDDIPSIAHVGIFMNYKPHSYYFHGCFKNENWGEDNVKFTKYLVS
jgi:hypothetical protein